MIKIKLLFIYFLIINHIKTNENKIVLWDSIKYYDFINENKFCLILIYQNFCKYSKETIQLFNFLSNNKNFNSYNIKLGILNLSKNENFDKLENIKVVPLIEFFIQGTKIEYFEDYKYDNIMKFIHNNLKLKDNVKKITDEEEFETIKKNNDNIIFYNGDLNSPRFSLFKTSIYRHPEINYYILNNVKLEYKLGLKKNSISILSKKFGLIKYDRAYNHKRYTHVVDKIMLYKSININNEEKYINFMSEKHPIILLFYKNETEYNNLNEILKTNFIKYFEKLYTYFCDSNLKICKRIIKKYNLDENENIYIINYNLEIYHPIIYKFKRSINNKNFKSFLKEYFNHKLNYEIISSDNLEDSKNPLSNIKNLKMITRKTYINDFTHQGIEDMVVLFLLNEKDDITDNVIEEFKKLVEINNNEKIFNAHFGYFYIDLNSHEFLKLKNKRLPFLRVFHNSYMFNFDDLEFNYNSIPKLKSKIYNFLHDQIKEINYNN